MAGASWPPLRAGGAERCSLAVNDLWYLAGGRALLSGINLTLGRSGITVLMGPNGAGKSLLLRVVHGLAAPTSGAVTWGGRSLNEETRRNIALVFQKPAPSPMLP